MNPAFFTRSPTQFELPHKRIDVRWILVAHNAVAAAIAILRLSGFDLRNAGENELTNELENILRNRLLRLDANPSLDPDFFRDVTRGSEVENFNGEKISKKPDLLFHLQRENTLWDRRQDALFAECKPVDKQHPLNGHYCAVEKDCTGIERFVIGDYAWAMEDALMIAYVRDGFQVRPHLENSLNKEPRKTKLGSPTPLAEIQATTANGEETTLYHTTHRRDFRWRNKSKATPITLYHSWHDCG